MPKWHFDRSFVHSIESFYAISLEDIRILIEFFGKLKFNRRMIENKFKTFVVRTTLNAEIFSQFPDENSFSA